MAEQRVGTCSICGGSVMGHRGPWWSVSPPPPDKCQQCGAVAQSDVIKMVPAPPRPSPYNAGVGGIADLSRRRTDNA